MIIAVISCSNNENSGVELELLIPQIKCVKGINLNNVYDNEFATKEFDSLSRNILEYKITNHSKRTYFMVLNEDILENIENTNSLNINRKDRKENCISFNLYKDNEILAGNIVSRTGGELNCNSPLLKELYNDSLFVANSKTKKIYKSKIVGPSFRNVLEHSFVLHPGEVKYFTSLVNLPWRKRTSTSTSWISNIDKQKPNFASMTFLNYVEDTKRMLSENQKKEIEENGYTIFNGILQSNKVPVVLISIPKS